jgi:hypothetical protein
VGSKLKHSSGYTAKKRDAATLALTRYIVLDGVHPMVVTEKEIRHWWRLLNDSLFMGILPEPDKIHIRRSRTTHAITHAGDNGHIDLYIHPRFRNGETLIEVIAHEMVHAWQHWMNLPLSHNRDFFQWKPLFTQRLYIKLRTSI